MPKDNQNNQGQKPKSQPQRKCIGCGAIKNKNEFIRVVRSPDDEISIDSRGKKSGRGAYICRDSGCLKKAMKSKRLDRSFKTKVSEEIFQQLVEMMNTETENKSGADI